MVVVGYVGGEGGGGGGGDGGEGSSSPRIDLSFSIVISVVLSSSGSKLSSRSGSGFFIFSISRFLVLAATFSSAIFFFSSSTFISFSRFKSSSLLSRATRAHTHGAETHSQQGSSVPAREEGCS